MAEPSELVKRLRGIVADFNGLKPYIVVCAEDAASLIESQEEEIGRLREALGWFLSDDRFQVAVGGNPIVVDRMLEAARSALSLRRNEEDGMDARMVSPKNAGA